MIFPAAFVTLATLSVAVVAAPLPAGSGSGGSAYTGAGGQTNGGSVIGSSGIHLLNIGSNNAGAGGFANTGSAEAGKGGDRDSVQSNVLAVTQRPQQVGILGQLLGNNVLQARKDESGTGGDAYTGVGGQANGGTTYRAGNRLGLDVLNVGSNNAGDAGKAASGAALSGAGGDSASSQSEYLYNLTPADQPSRLSEVLDLDLIKRHDGGDAYTGVGGQANGGTIYRAPDNSALGRILPDLHILNINSGNAGDGGDASSGSALGGEGGNVKSLKTTYASSALNQPVGALGPAARPLDDVARLVNLPLAKRAAGDVYTGIGGQATDGNSFVRPATSLTSGAQILSVVSDNASTGEIAASGHALGASAESVRLDRDDVFSS